MWEEIKRRKLEHINLCRTPEVELGENWFDLVELIPHSLPEVNFNDISLGTKFLKKHLRAPILIEGMTGGFPGAENINRKFASVAERFELAFGVGSQRAALVHPEIAYTFQVRDVFTGPLLANIGAAQVVEFGVDGIVKVIEMIDADAVAVHVNPGQEAIQREGDKNWKGVKAAIKEAGESIPIILKGTGEGIDRKTVEELIDSIVAVDVGGRGGTSFIRIEYLRRGASNRTFERWGIPTPANILWLRDLDITIIGSGGIRNGLEIAKAMVLGADLAGMARPFIEHIDNLESFVEKIIEELKIALFLLGAKKLEDIKKVRYILLDPLKSYVEQLLEVR